MIFRPNHLVIAYALNLLTRSVWSRLHIIHQCMVDTHTSHGSTWSMWPTKNNPFDPLGPGHAVSL